MRMVKVEMVRKPASENAVVENREVNLPISAAIEMLDVWLADPAVSSIKLTLENVPLGTSEVVWLARAGVVRRKFRLMAEMIVRLFGIGCSLAALGLLAYMAWG